MKNNKGFSLVELIIVIAIMAILVGVMAPQLIKYIEKSRISSDTQLCDTVRSAITTAILDPAVVESGDALPTSGSAETFCTSGSKLGPAVVDILGTSTPSSQLKSTTASAAGNSINVLVESGNQITVYVGSGIGAGPNKASIGTLN